MKHALIWALGLVFSGSTFASHLVPLKAEICGQVAGLQSWTFTKSEKFLNDVPDYQGYIRVVFSSAVVEGRHVQATQTFKIKNLVWDKKFKALYFKGQDGITVCGISSDSGIHLSESCGLKFQAKEVIPSPHCNNVEVTLLEGTFAILSSAH